MIVANRVTLDPEEVARSAGTFGSGGLTRQGRVSSHTPGSAAAWTTVPDGSTAKAFTWLLPIPSLMTVHVSPPSELTITRRCAFWFTPAKRFWGSAGFTARE